MTNITALTLADQLYHDLNESGLFIKVVREYEVFENMPEYTKIVAVWGQGSLKAIAVLEMDDVILIGYLGSFTFWDNTSDFIAVDNVSDAVEVFIDQLDGFWESVL